MLFLGEPILLPSRSNSVPPRKERRSSCCNIVISSLDANSAIRHALPASWAKGNAKRELLAESVASSASASR
jgi:hypothetical protein